MISGLFSVVVSTRIKTPLDFLFSSLSIVKIAGLLVILTVELFLSLEIVCLLVGISRYGDIVVEGLLKMVNVNVGCDLGATG